MALGFLAVLSEPGGQVSVEEFQDWYNNEHVPLRLNHLPCFLSGARFQAVDGKKPSWLAVYDIDDTSTFSHESYTRLRTNRSSREADLIKRLELLDRRTFAVWKDSGESTITSSLRCSNPTPVVVTHGLALPEDSPVTTQKLEAWWKSVVDKLKPSDGWARSRIFECIDSGKTGTSVDDGQESQEVPKYFVLHEFKPESESTFEKHESIFGETETGLNVVEIRRWRLYRAYPCVAQGNLP